MAQFLRDLKKALYTGTDKWETSYDPNLLQDGTYMKNLAIARKTVEAEIGHEKWKEIHEPSIVYDTLLCTLVPLASWICMYFTWNYPLSSPIFWVAALIHGWLILGSFLLYHDVLAHRMAFGVWGSWIMGLWVSSHGMLANGLHAFWGMRHCMTHHKRTFEKVDCDLSGHDMSSRITRSIFFIGALRQFIRLQFWRDMDRKHNSNKIPEWYPGDIGKVKEIQYFIDGWNRVLRNTIYIVMAYYYPLDTFKMLLIPQTFMGFPDMVRYVFEHAEHDRNNPFWHATPYQSTTFVRTLWFCEMGDCHAIHHLFPKVPMYRMHLATKYINPIIRKHGVPDRNSFWEIMYGYFILGLPHGQRWDNFRNWKLTKTN